MQTQCTHSVVTR